MERKINDLDLSKTITGVIKKLCKKEDELMQPYGLTHFHTKYLGYIYYSKTATMSDLTTFSGTDKANTTRVVKDLLKQEIVTKSGGERKFKLNLTEKGKQIAEHFKQQKDKFMQKVFKDFKMEEIETLKALLEKLFIGATSAIMG